MGISGLRYRIKLPHYSFNYLKLCHQICSCVGDILDSLRALKRSQGPQIYDSKFFGINEIELWEDVNMISTIQNHAWESAFLKQSFGWFQGIGAPQSLDVSFMIPWDEGYRFFRDKWL